ncbi:SET domain-containing protein-lysine N-methyltransferase [Ruficoccus sp. ZRK36]|uniref:SET domain-containing protein n=1 Tax=Ruficoccus sp. ZRK36 TaxID=2866311 RepID=UPI001C736257|nr:SET domain-containing protein-lysine N-methyltransferase [Ruficoccus sp. ZRK36]QYY35759.1 SET domain-containing protein-lysine N-methyltransferase [Ruficoccus sp. ZRK36]
MAKKEEGQLWELRKSSIHNQGMFATADIEAGTRVIQYIGEKIPKKESTRRALEWEEKARKKGEGLVYIFDLNKRYDLDGNVPNNPAKYVNHSCDPNCEAVNYDGEIWIVSMRDIKEGEELGFDYGYDIQHFMDHPCRCGSENCIGYIVAREFWPKLRKLLKNKKKAEKIGRKKAKAAEEEKPKRKKKAAKKALKKSAVKKKSADKKAAKKKKKAAKKASKKK